MGDIDGSKRLPALGAGQEGYFSQLHTGSRKASRQPSKLFSGFAAFSFGFFSLFPSLPQVQPETFAVAPEPQNEVKAVQNDEKEEDSSKAEKKNERCLWQEDVAFFAEIVKDNEKAMKKGCVPEEDPQEEVSDSEKATAELDKEIRDMAAGYPIEDMAPSIAHFDREVAGLIVGIAKKESNWGKRVPTKNGEDCYNYWGYKGAGSKGTAMGHGCFGSPEEAVTIVGERIEELVEKRKGSEPSRMVVWKCGSSCATHSKESVNKWISDVNIYYRQIAKK